MRVEPFESNDEALLSETWFTDVGTVVTIMAPVSALNGEPGPVVFETPDPERTIVVWAVEYLSRLFGSVETVSARLNILGRIIQQSYQAVVDQREEM